MNSQLSPQQLSRVNTLLRIVLSVIFVPTYLLVAVAIFALASVELIIAFFVGRKPPLALMRVADRAVCYSGQIANYLILVDSEAPFPFNPLPPASDLLAEHALAVDSVSGYADADDTTITAAGRTATTVDGQEVTQLSSPVQGGLADADLHAGDTTQLNPDRDPEELLDETWLQLGPDDSTEENIAVASVAAEALVTEQGEDEESVNLDQLAAFEPVVAETEADEGDDDEPLGEDENKNSSSSTSEKPD